MLNTDKQADDFVNRTAMMISPAELLDTSVAQLQTLTAFWVSSSATGTTDQIPPHRKLAHAERSCSRSVC